MDDSLGSVRKPSFVSRAARHRDSMTFTTHKGTFHATGAPADSRGGVGRYARGRRELVRLTWAAGATAATSYASPATRTKTSLLVLALRRAARALRALVASFVEADRDGLLAALHRLSATAPQRSRGRFFDFSSCRASASSTVCDSSNEASRAAIFTNAR